MENKRTVSEKAKRLIERNPVVFDTETTGLGRDAEIIEIAAMDMDGNVLVDSYVKPRGIIPKEATAVHGIILSDLPDAPTFDILWKGTLEELFRRRVVCAYNVDFDMKMIRQSLRIYGLKPARGIETVCLMRMFAEYRGDWDSRNNRYKWYSLENAARYFGLDIPEGLHRAIADTRLARLLLLKMAGEDMPAQ